MMTTDTTPAALCFSEGLGAGAEARLPGEWIAPTQEAAHAMGATGGPVAEVERLAFEAWMRGHCWALCATWTGTEYRSEGEQGGWPDPQAMATRRLWAAWRDRAALANTGRWRRHEAPNVGIEPPYSVGSNDGLGPNVEKREEL